MQKVQKPKKPLIFYYLMVLVILVLLNTFFFPKVMQQEITTVSYSTFLSMLDEEKVAQVDVQSNQILFIDNEDPANYYCTGVMDDPNLVDRLEQSGATYGAEIETEPSFLSSFFGYLLTIVFFLFIGQLLSRFLMKKMGIAVAD